MQRLDQRTVHVVAAIDERGREQTGQGGEACTAAEMGTWSSPGLPKATARTGIELGGDDEQPAGKLTKVVAATGAGEKLGEDPIHPAAVEHAGRDRLDNPCNEPSRLLFQERRDSRPDRSAPAAAAR